MNNDLKKAIELAERAKEGIEPGGSTVTERLQKSHVKAYTRTTASGATVQVKEHDDSRQKHIPPQADSNRSKWDDLPDDENPKHALWRISSKELGRAAKGKTDLRQAAKEELANRGVDEHGKWLGFDKAAAHHGAKGFKPGHDFDADEVYGHFQTVHHKVLGAIATGHLDPKRLASEELANRGHDHNGDWIGFDKASKLHKVK